MCLAGSPGGVIWRILRRSDILARVSILGCAALFAVGAATVLESLSLSNRQVRERDFGTYSAASVFASPDPANWAWASLDTLVQRIGGRSEAALASPGIRVGASDRTDVYLHEGRWPIGASGGVGLHRGRWPVAPGEVVVVEREGFEAQVGEVLNVFSGRTSLSVVGVATDLYGEQPKLLAAPGTLMMLSEALNDYRADGANPLDVLLLLHWDVAKTTSEEVLIATAEFNMGDGEGLTSYRTDAMTDRGWVSKLPAAFAGPASLILAGSVGVSIAAIRSRLSRFQRIVALLGGPSSFSTLILTAVSALAFLVVAAAGGGAGFVLAVLARPAIRSVSGEPIGEIEVPWLAVQMIAVVISLGVGVVGMMGWRDGPERVASEERPHEPSGRGARRAKGGTWTGTRRILASASLAGAVFAFEEYSFERAMVGQAFVVVAGLLVVPDLVGLLPRDSGQPVRRLVLRGLRSEHRRVSTSVVALSLLLSLPLAWEVFLSSAVAHRTAQDRVRLRDDEVVVADETSTLQPPRQEVLAIAERELSPASGIEVRYLGDIEGYVGPTKSADLLGVLDSVKGIEAVLGTELDDQTVAALEAGRVLTWAQVASEDDPVADATVELSRFDADDGSAAAVGEIQTVPLRVQRNSAFDPLAEFQRTHYGVLLASAVPATLGTSTIERIVFLGVSDDQVERLKERVRDAGYPAETIQSFELRPVIAPAAWTLSLSMLTGMMILTTFVFIRSSVRGSRRSVQAVLALGAPRGTITYMSVVTMAVPLALAFVVALVVSTVPTMVSFAGGGVATDLSPLRIGTLCLAYFLTATAGVTVGARKLRAEIHRR